MPRTPKGTKRTELVAVRLTKAELADLDTRRKGLSRSDFLRARIKGETTNPIPMRVPDPYDDYEDGNVLSDGRGM